MASISAGLTIQSRISAADNFEPAAVATIENLYDGLWVLPTEFNIEGIWYNEQVFAVYTPDIRAARSAKLLTGLPDAYGRGRIIGDYRRVALYGVNKLIEEKKKDKARLANEAFNTERIRLDEELYQQIAFLGYMKEMAQMYGFDIDFLGRCQ